MAVVAFTGTSTGDTYKVGQSYTSAGRTYTAQADGSFKTTNRDGTSRSVVGSSQSDTATFYVSQSGGASGDGSAKSGAVKGAASAAHVNASTAGGKTSSAPGSAPYTGNGPGSLPRLVGGSGTPSKTTRLFWDSVPISMNPNTSDGGDFEQRWGEWGGALGGLAVMADDLVVTPVRDWWVNDLPTEASASGRGFVQAVTSGWGGQGTTESDLAKMRQQSNAITGGGPRNGWGTGGGF